MVGLLAPLTKRGVYGRIKAGNAGCGLCPTARMTIRYCILRLTENVGYHRETGCGRGETP
jgi:hypothetical protein